jgi:hypothetical protein
MSIIATAVKHMLAAGLTGDALVAAIAEMEACAPAAAVDATAARRRERDAAYQAMKRAERAAGRPAKSRRQKSAESADSADSADVADSPPPNDIYSNPPPISPNASHSPRARVRQSADFPKPDWADDQVWTDFLSNRKRKGLSNTPTAHRKLLADIDRIADAHWPPGRLLEAATAKGWGAIYPSIKSSEDETHNGQRSHNRPEHRHGPTTGAAVDFIATG